jgi:hypothetical protein
MKGKRALSPLLALIVLLAGCAEVSAPEADNEGSKPSEANLAMIEASACANVVSEASRPNGQPPQGTGTPLADEATQNVLVIEGGDSYRWNDAPVDPTMLRQYLDVTHTMRPTPRLVVRRGDGADEASLTKAREIIYLALDCRADI